MSRYKLDPVVKHRILKALRSGKYEYCGGRLYEKEEDEENGSYCTLGVIYHTLGVSNEILEGRGALSSNAIPEHIRKCIPEFLLDDGFKHTEIRKEVGKEQFYNEWKSFPAYRIPELNDDNCSYDEAIKYIEENL